MSNINTWPGWECVRQLGAGAFGKVYEIQREENGKVYKAALKVISIPQNESDIEGAFSEGMDRHSVTEYFKSFVNDFSNEISLMSDLKGYTNIVSYEDHMVIPHESGIGWDILIRMELLTPLLKWVVDHPLSENDVIRLGCDMCQALILCHKNKIIHRDIKPENIFVNKNGDFKLGDFGIARVVERTASVMSQKGTYTYMAPEVFKGLKYNETADIYSLGIVLYRFLNESRTPFLPMGNLVYTDRQAAQDRRMSGEAIPSPKNGSVEFKALVLKALEYDPKKRFHSAKEMKNVLEQCEKEYELSEKLSSIEQDLLTEFEKAANTQDGKLQENSLDDCEEETASVIRGVHAPAKYEKVSTEEKKKMEQEIAASLDNEEQTVLNIEHALPKKVKKKRWIPIVLISVFVIVGAIGGMLLLPENNDDYSQPSIMIKENLLIYKDITAGELLKTLDENALIYKNGIFSVSLREEGNIIGVYKHDGWYRENGVEKLKKDMVIEHLEGNLHFLMNGVDNSISLEEFCELLAWDEKVEYTIEQGGYYQYSRSAAYIQILFDSDGDGSKDAKLCFGDVYKNKDITPNTYVWLYMDVKE